MAMKIDQKIKGYSVVSAEDRVRETAAPDAAQAADLDSNVVQMHEKIERPETLIGTTYKLKTPLFEHALYVTINDIILNAGSEHEHRRPFEIFINSKNMDHFQWIVALTRIMSAVFRKGGDVTFLVEEMKAVFDPRGGYFKAGGVYMPSLVAELGSIVEEHLKSIGMIQDPEMSAAQRELIAEKRAAYAAMESKKKTEVTPVAQKIDAAEPPPRDELSGHLFPEPRVTDTPRSEDVEVTGDGGVAFPPSAAMCHKCSTKAIVIMDGCATCLNCGYSKCG
ncbi:NrdJb [Novilysobacter antarcticus]|uniref:TSCPD domain-containing protein n=1 Tax=Novilysobacter antarcticus TaxID=2862543 RepID=UPI001C9982A8|nr:NrdJb [Lysobacter antarcticus]